MTPKIIWRPQTFTGDSKTVSSSVTKFFRTCFVILRFGFQSKLPLWVVSLHVLVAQFSLIREIDTFCSSSQEYVLFYIFSFSHVRTSPPFGRHNASTLNTDAARCRTSAPSSGRRRKSSSMTRVRLRLKLHTSHPAPCTPHPAPRTLAFVVRRIRFRENMSLILYLLRWRSQYSFFSRDPVHPPAQLQGVHPPTPSRFSPSHSCPLLFPNPQRVWCASHGPYVLNKSHFACRNLCQISLRGFKVSSPPSYN